MSNIPEKNNNSIFPKNDHLKVTTYFLTYLGIYPLELSHRPYLKIAYKIYGEFMYIYFFLYILTQFIEMFILMKSNDIGRLMQNIGTSCLTGISIVRVTAVRGRLSRHLVGIIFEVEEKIYKSQDEEITKIYKKYADRSNYFATFFITVGMLTSIPFYFEPMGVEKTHPELYKPNNITGKIETKRLLPLSSWYWYDTNEYYWITFAWQVITGFIIEGFIVYTDVFMFSLMIFPVGQMKILQYILENFDKYSEKIHREQMPKDGLESASKATIRACVLMHKEIIEFVGELDHALRFIMLLDFLSCSLQMSVVLFQIIMFEFGIPMLHAVEFLVTMIIQMFLFYWNANEIIVESNGIGKAIWNGKWYNQSEPVKKCLAFMILRSQKPLTLSIGPFYPMSVETALSILKATYSYGMLLEQSYHRRMN